jgi:TonB family protein
MIQGNSLPGTYQLLWLSPEHWREEINLPGYQRIEIRANHHLWIRRNLNHEIPSVMDLDGALGFSDILKTTAKAKPGKLKSRNVSGAALQCSEIHQDYAHHEYFCFDMRKQALKAELFPHGNAYAPNITAVDYSDFVPFAKNLYPHTIKIMAAATPIITFSVVKLAPLTNFPKSDFAAPSASGFWSSCADPKFGKPTKRVLPVYPDIERTEGQGGEAVLYARLRPDGTVHNVAVEYSADVRFDAAAEAAVKQWRYSPTTCNGNPVPWETYIKVYFSIGPP